MATIHPLKAERRKRTGSGLLKQMRREGWLPSVVYGKHAENVNLKVDARRFSDLLRESESENLLLSLEVAGEDAHLAFLQSIQYDTLKGIPIHVDFLAVTEKTRITAHVPVRLNGEPAGVKLGGMLDHIIHDMEIQCAATQLPELLEFDVSGLNMGDSLTIGEITLPEGVVPLYNPEDVIAIVVEPTVSQDTAEEEAAPAAPEAAPEAKPED